MAAPLFVVISALIFYLLTVAPDVLWGDSGKFQWMAWAGWLVFDETGHPVWVMLLNPFCHLPGLRPATICNLSSALLSALALWPAYRIMRRLGASAPAAWIACLALAVSHTFWFHATITEVYAFNSLVTLALLDAILAAVDPAGDRVYGAAGWMVIGLVWGLTTGNHLLVGLWGPGFAWLMYRGWKAGRLSFHGIVACGAGAALGLVPLVALRMKLGGQESFLSLASRLAQDAMHAGRLAHDLAVSIGYLIYQFPVPVMVAAALLGVTRVRRDARVGLILIYLANAAFALSYQVKDRFAFFLPSYLVVSLLAGAGLDPILSTLRRAVPRGVAIASLLLVCVAIPPVLYRAAPALAAAGLLPIGGGARQLPGRDPVRYFLDPDKRGDEGARWFAAAALDAMDENAVLLADFTLAQPLNYLQIVEGKRPDVLVTYRIAEVPGILEWIRSGRQVYIGALDGYYEIDRLSAAFRIVAAGPVYRLEPLPPSG